MSHLKTNNIGYFKHCARALRMSAICLKASAILSVHAFLPFLFETTGSDSIKKLSREIERSQGKR